MKRPSIMVNEVELVISRDKYGYWLYAVDKQGDSTRIAGPYRNLREVEKRRDEEKSGQTGEKAA